MPTGDNRVISEIVHFMIRVFPDSLLDLGIGYGKYGALAREYVDWNRYGPGSRRVRIVGVEGFPEYETPLWKLYSEVRIEDFGDERNWPQYRGFDLVLLADSLEHLELAQGRALLTHLIAENRNVLVCVPEGPYDQGPAYSNVLECHRATWTTERLRDLGGLINSSDRRMHGGELCTVAKFSQ